MIGSVLLVDDEEELCRVLAERLRRRDYRVEWTTHPATALEILASWRPDVAVLDLRMPGIDGLELARRILARSGEVAVVLLTAFGSFETAVAALRAGAYDFLSKPVEAETLERVLRRAVERRRHRTVGARAHRHEPESAAARLVGASEPMRALRAMVARVAASDASVLVQGETGTGKELVARAVHEASDRAGGPFIAVNCAALPTELLESELFGHARGAFTGALRARPGLFVQAHGGTLFLDEIGDLPVELQPKLLRVLQERRVRPVGSDEETALDVRVVAATHRQLETEVAAGRFRSDLFFRLDVLGLEVPPLRERDQDVLELATCFLQRLGARTGRPARALSEAASERLLRYAWPGNVRELENCIERAVALAGGERIGVDDLPRRVREGSEVRRLPELAPGELTSLEEMERRYVRRVLDAVEGNKSVAARILDIDRKTLYRKLEPSQD